MLEQLDEINNKLDKLIKMEEDLYSLAIYGKRCGLEGKVRNMARATFMIERQYKELTSAMGEELSKGGHELKDLRERCEDIVELIINSYDGILPKAGEGTGYLDNDGEGFEEPDDGMEEEEGGIKFTGEDMDALLRFMGAN
jgi:hypothetical protein